MKKMVDLSIVFPLKMVIFHSFPIKNATSFCNKLARAAIANNPEERNNSGTCEYTGENTFGREWLDVDKRVHETVARAPAIEVWNRL